MTPPLKRALQWFKTVSCKPLVRLCNFKKMSKVLIFKPKKCEKQTVLVAFKNFKVGFTH